MKLKSKQRMVAFVLFMPHQKTDILHNWTVQHCLVLRVVFTRFFCSLAIVPRAAQDPEGR
jgi:hypothetical protein